MALTWKREGRALTAEIAGEVDHHAARAMGPELERQAELLRPKTLIVDLGGVSFMDSSGIALLFRAKRRMEELGGAVAVRGAKPQALRVLRAAGLDRMMRFEA